MQERKCLIHVGTHKTGTSAIQSFLSNNNEILERFGYHYPRIGDCGAHHNIAFSLFDTNRVSVYGTDTIEKLLQHINRTTDDIILSSEEFIHAIHYNSVNFEAFIKLLTPYFSTIELAVYLREQSSYLLSNYCERLKYGLSLPFNEYVERRLRGNLAEFPVNYQTLVEEIESIDGAKLIVRPYDASVDSVSDFLSLCGITADQEGAANRGVNAINDVSESLLLFFRNHFGREPVAFERGVIEKLTHGCSGRHLKLNEATIGLIHRSLSASNFAIARRFGLNWLEGAIVVPNTNSRPTNRDFEAETLQPTSNRSPGTLSPEMIFSVEYIASIAMSVRRNRTPRRGVSDQWRRRRSGRAGDARRRGAALVPRSHWN